MDIITSLITGHIYIADHFNHCIQVLSPDLTFSHAFGTKGSAEGQFNDPGDIAIDRQGLVYVADISNHCIQTFTSEGQFLSQFGTKGFYTGQFICPSGIIIHDDNLMYIQSGVIIISLSSLLMVCLYVIMELMVALVLMNHVE